MRILRQLSFCFVAVAAHTAISLETTAATIAVTDWVVHNTNGSITVAGAATNSPTFTAVDIATDTMSIMAPFPSITLANDGDYIKLTTTLTMTNRSGTGVNTLNTHLRFGLFNGPVGAVVASDTPNYGILAQYANSNQGHLKVYENNTATVDPLSGSLALIGEQPTYVTVDPENDAIQGANPTATYEMTLTRSGGNLAITGQISGGSYLSSFSLPAFSSATFPANSSFNFNRVGFFLGNNVNAQGGSTFSNVVVETNVPEPASLALLGSAIGVALIARKRADRAR